jgi:hypothetical protein
MRVYDVSSPEKPREIAFFDTSGPRSRGAHFVWFVDGEYAFLATGSSDFVPTHPQDDQFLMIVDLREPEHPREVGRYWMSGTRKGDAEPPPPRLKFDSGYRLHSLFTPLERADRAYGGWIDGGVVILDIQDRAEPKLIARRSWYPPEVGFTHTAHALLDRGILVASEEAVRDRCEDWPKRVWMVDLASESDPRPIAPFPAPSNLEELCRRGGRFGAHNIHVNRPGPHSRRLTQTVVGSFFNGGVRVYSISDPRRPEEIGFLIPEAPPGNPSGTIQINDVYVDEKGSTTPTTAQREGSTSWSTPDPSRCVEWIRKSESAGASGPALFARLWMPAPKELRQTRVYRCSSSARELETVPGGPDSEGDAVALLGRLVEPSAHLHHPAKGRTHFDRGSPPREVSRPKNLSYLRSR